MVNKNKTTEKPPQVSNRQIVIILLIVMLLFLSIRILSTSNDTTNDDIHWSVSINAEFDAQQAKSVLSISRPYETAYNHLIQQSIKHEGLKIRNVKHKDESIRGITGIATKDGQINTSVEYLIQQSSTPRVFSKHSELSTKLREKYLKDEPWLSYNDKTIANVINKINKKTNDKESYVNNIYEFSKNLKPLNHKETKLPSIVIKHKKGTILERALVLVSLARAKQIPSRLITGFILKESPNTTTHHWVQIYLDNKWLSFDPFYGYARSVPENYMPFRYNNAGIVELKNGENLTVTYYIKHNFDVVVKPKYHTPHWYNILDLSRLNLDSRDSLALLLLLPIGVFITVIFRHFIGVHSYGVFTPSLLSLAVTRNDWITTLITVSIIVLFYAPTRKLLPGHLSKTPRLSIIFTIVALSMAMSISVLDYYLPSPDGYAVLLPIVILTSLIDKFYLAADEKGLNVAYIRLLWTFVITATCLPAIQYLPLGHLLVKYPELHLLTLSCILIITSYRGNKLSMYLPTIIRNNVGL